jgi:hypothetical protein
MTSVHWLRCGVSDPEAVPDPAVPLDPAPVPTPR